MSAPDLPLLSEHGRVLLLLHADPTASQQEIADALGVSLRQASRLFADIKDNGYITTEPAGRRLRATICADRSIGDGGPTLGVWIKRQRRRA